VGVPFPALPLQIMAARLADSSLRDLVFTGRTVQIDEAKAMGLIDEKCPSGCCSKRHGSGSRLATIPAGALLTRPFAPILQRAAQFADLNARWSRPGYGRIPAIPSALI
jgi:enoyl-CoA hydratase/carnithine racemase